MDNDVPITFTIPKWLFTTLHYVMLCGGFAFAGGAIVFGAVKINEHEIARAAHEQGFQAGRESCTEPGGLERAAKMVDSVMFRTHGS